jgi:hypothetical protein
MVRGLLLFRCERRDPLGRIYVHVREPDADDIGFARLAVQPIAHAVNRVIDVQAFTVTL